MKVDKIFNAQTNTFEADLSQVDEVVLGYNIESDQESYKVEVEIDPKRLAYENEVSHLVQQYTRLQLMMEFERLPELLEEITNKTIEIRLRYL